jgi:phosphoesterase RecJ-like protein
VSIDGNGAATRTRVLGRIRHDRAFVLATHENPDGDALGSLVGMHGLLAELGKEVTMFIPAEDLPLPYEYGMFRLEDLVQTPPADIGERTVVFLDCGNIDRISAQALREGAHLVNLDHHHDNTHFGTLNYVVPSASCTAEIVWDLMHGLGVAPTSIVAQALYVGLITDTGRFMYENTGPEAHRMAAELIEAGVDVPGISKRLYEELPPAKLALAARALARVQRFDGGQLTLAAVAPRTSARPAPRTLTRRGSSTSCAPCRARRSRCSCASSRPGSARDSTKCPCGPLTTTSTCRRSRGNRAGGATGAPRASPPRCPSMS